jgi:hypothetical protein
MSKVNIHFKHENAFRAAKKWFGTSSLTDFYNYPKGNPDTPLEDADQADEIVEIWKLVNDNTIQITADNYDDQNLTDTISEELKIIKLDSGIDYDLFIL